jgi:Bacterial regulatory protein, Fis family
MQSKMSGTGEPSFLVYSKGRDQNDARDWLRIGTAFAHDDGRGFDVVLHELPLRPEFMLRNHCGGQSSWPEGLIASRHLVPDRPPSLRQQVEAFERGVIERCLMENGGRFSAVMELLDVPRRTLSEKIQRLGIDRRRFLGEAAQCDRAFEQRSLAPNR